MTDATPLASEQITKFNRIRTSMALLQQNSEGCALNHYGSDAETQGLPGWLVDTKRDLDAFTALISSLPFSAQKETAAAKALFEHEMRERGVFGSWEDLDDDDRAGWQLSVDVVLAAAAPLQAMSRGMEEASMRDALEVGDRFVRACFSAWSCGEPYHRVKTMMDRAEEFQAALAALSATPAPSRVVALDEPNCTNDDYLRRKALTEMVAMDEQMEAEHPGWMTGEFTPAPSDQDASPLDAATRSLQPRG